MQEYRHGIKDHTVCSAEHQQKSHDSRSRSNQWANKYTVEQVKGARFKDSNGNLVDCLNMTAIRDIAAFLGCARNTISLALQRTGDKKGIVFGVWKVKKLDSSDPIDVDSSIALGEKSSCSQSQIDLGSMAPFTLFSDSPSVQPVEDWETPFEPSLRITCASTPTELLDDASSWQISQFSSSLGVEARSSSTSVTQSSGDAMQSHKNPIDMTCLAMLHSNQTQHLHSIVQATATGQTLLYKCKMKSFTGGPAVKLYHVSQKHGEAFELEGKLVSSAVMITDSSVAKVTGATRTALDKAKLYTNIKWGIWLISYLGEVPSGDDMIQDILKRVSTIPARPRSSDSEYNKLCQDHDQEISHGQSMHVYNSNHYNQHDLYEALHESTSVDLVAPGSSFASIHPPSLAAGTQSLPSKGSSGVQKEGMTHTTTQLSSATAWTTVQRRRNQHSDTTRAKISLHSANVKVFHIERANGTLFKYKDGLVAFVDIQTSSAAIKFLGCAVSTLYDSLKAKGRRKGIVKQKWRVTVQGDGPALT